MRRIITFWILGTVVLLSQPITARAAQSALAGDLNGNGVVSLSEVQTVINAYLGVGTATGDAPAVVAITTSALKYAQMSTFIVTGSNLGSSVITASDSCTNLTEVAGGTPAARSFTCTPSAVGPLTVTATAASGGTQLMQTSFSVPSPQITMVTSKGTIVVELYPAKAPVTVNNFLQYVNSGFYNNTIFHRVVSGFVVQGGGFDTSYSQKATLAPIVLETPAVTGLSNLHGTIAMARTSVLNSATSQFYVNTVDNAFLDTSSGGYAVFGNVIQGMNVVGTIAAVAVDSNSVPTTMVTVTSATQTL